MPSPNALRICLGVLDGNDPLLLEVALVPSDSELDLAPHNLSQLLHPALDPHERLLVGDIVDEQRCICRTVMSWMCV